MQFPEFFMWYASEGPPPPLLYENEYWEPIRKSGVIDHWRFRKKRQNCNCGSKKETQVQFIELN